LGTIRIENLTKAYGNNTVIENLNLEIKKGERLVLLGPSGCGKSTILRMIAGIEDITSGSIYFDDHNVTNLSAGQRNVAMVFQNYALYPHMSVENNITYALKRNKIDKQDIESRLSNVLRILELEHLRKRKPKDLSGGQRQRVALARAVVKNSQYFLLDEPLSNLDALLRVSARQELIELHELYKHTFVYVTHDQIEAMALADRIVVLNEGEIQMIDSPQNIYNNPRNIFTARFIGSPPMNILKGTIKQNQLYINDDMITVSDYLQKQINEYSKNEIYIGIRPEDINLTMDESSMTFNMSSSENFGREFALTGQINDQHIIISTEKLPDTESIKVTFEPENIRLFDIDSEINLGEI